MKAGFSLTKRFVPKWHDNDKADAADQLVAVFSMPTISDVFTILDALQSSGAKDSTKLDIQGATKIVQQAGNFLPQYVKLENAEDFSIEDVVKYPPYFPLANELLFALVAFAQPTDSDAKNSNGLPA
jgi:hypothetical protein